jgi:hypothetical protein
MLAGLAALGAGFAVAGFWPDRPALSGALLAAGATALLWSLWDLGRRVRRSRYHRWIWGRDDRLVLATNLVAASGWVVAWLLRSDWLFYYPYPPYSPWPVFQPVLGALILLLAVPELLLRPRVTSEMSR